MLATLTLFINLAGKSESLILCCIRLLFDLYRAVVDDQ